MRTQARRNKQFVLRRHSVSFSVGHLVLVYRPIKKKGRP